MEYAFLERFDTKNNTDLEKENKLKKIIEDKVKEHKVKEHKDGLKNYKDELKLVKKEVVKLVVTALGFVTALAWNSAFQNLFQGNSYLNAYGPWIYALIITIITVFATINIKNI